MKNIIFRLVEPKSIMIKAILNDEGLLLFEKLNETDHYTLSQNEVDKIGDNFNLIFDEDNQALNDLIKAIKKDITLYDKISNQKSNKLIIEYI